MSLDRILRFQGWKCLLTLIQGNLTARKKYNSVLFKEYKIQHAKM